MYKMIVFDIDGTLLKYNISEHIFDAKIRKMFKLLKENNYIVVLASGRDYISIGDLIKTENVDYFIGANGSFIHDLNQDKNIWNTTISMNDFENFKTNIFDKNLSEIDNLILSDNKNIFVNYPDKIKNHWFWKNFYTKIKQINLYKNELYLDYFHLITVNCKDTKFIDISKNFFENTNSSLFVQASWKNGFFISQKDLNKATTIKRLANILGFSISEIIAFGDGENDMQMIEMVGLGIAMGNGTDEIKLIANDVAKSVNDYGTYYKLKELGII